MLLCCLKNFGNIHCGSLGVLFHRLIKLFKCHCLWNQCIHRNRFENTSLWAVTLRKNVIYFPVYIFLFFSLLPNCTAWLTVVSISFQAQLYRGRKLVLSIGIPNKGWVNVLKRILNFNSVVSRYFCVCVWQTKNTNSSKNSW